MARIGVFVCWCGSNIAGTVDVKKVAEEVSKLPYVVYSTDYKYMCSDPGQNMIKEAIKEHRLTGVVVSACSPRMHEVTFRRTVQDEGINPYMMEMANIREHCSWVHDDMEQATEKAIELVRMAVAKAVELEPMEKIEVPVTKRALVIGGGIAGIQAALDIADGGVEVILVEKSPSIGGKMSQLDETFPTLDCSQCILTPKMVDAAQHPNIKIYSYAELEELDGFIGNFKARIRQKARSVDMDLCNGCGDCWNKCPQKKIPSEFEAGMSYRSAIYVPFPQAIPNTPVIDRENCIYFQSGKCGICAKICPTGAISYDQSDEFITEEVGAVVVATGYDLFNTDVIGEYGYGEIPDVISGLQFERLSSASGPTEGKIVRPSDGKEPEEVAFICCVGSRDDKYGRPYCSRICCMYTAKHTILLHHKLHGSQAYVFYIDVRAGGKGYEEFIRRATEEEGAIYMRGRVSRLYRDNGKVVVKGADTLSGAQIELHCDMVVLANGIIASPGAEELARKLGISYDEYGFYSEAHPKLRPVETNTAGIYLAGCCQAPKDIPDSVSQASASASKVLALFSGDFLTREPNIAEVNPFTCTGCFTCREACPYDAIDEEEVSDQIDGEKVTRTIARVNPGKCQGCGICCAVCRSNAVNLKGTKDLQIFRQIKAFTGSEGEKLDEPVGLKK